VGAPVARPLGLGLLARGREILRDNHDDFVIFAENGRARDRRRERLDRAAFAIGARLASEVAAVDGGLGTRDERGSRREREQNRVGHLLRRTQAPRGVKLSEVLESLSGEGVQERSFDVAGVYRD
jgi:hypothetical protein